jgi:hypothetical protein
VRIGERAIGRRRDKKGKDETSIIFEIEREKLGGFLVRSSWMW